MKAPRLFDGKKPGKSLEGWVMLLSDFGGIPTEGERFESVRSGIASFLGIFQDFIGLILGQFDGPYRPTRQNRC